MKTINHICKESTTCSCDIMGFEPDDFCPQHGGSRETWPPKCEICGRFIKQRKEDSCQI